MPSTILARYEARARFVLALLEDNPDGLRHKEIKAKWIVKGFPESMFNSLFQQLKKRGYIAKKTSDHLSSYILTGIGKRKLAGLRV